MTLTSVMKNIVYITVGSESMIPKKPDEGRCAFFCRQLRKLIMISERHPLVYEHVRSFPALVAERQRHWMENKNVIHPLSMFRFAWGSLMIIINLLLIMLSSLRLFIIVDPSDKLQISEIDIVIVNLQVICAVDMIICFNTGVLGGEADIIELDRRRIAWAYLRSFWTVDLMSCIPVSFLMLLAWHRTRHDYLIPDILPLARTIRLVTVLSDLRALLRTMTTSHIHYQIVRHALLLILSIHCFTCLLFVPSVYVHYVIVNLAVYNAVPRTYTTFLDTIHEKRVFYDLPASQRYIKGMFMAISAFYSTGFHMFRTLHQDEIIVNSLILLFGTMFKMYTIVFVLKTYMVLYNSTLRYQELMDQVEKYMQHQQFPASLMKRLRDFYCYRFQERYFKESGAIGCLSAHLRDEICLHTYQTWMAKIPVLQDLPPDFLGSLLGCLVSEVYMTNDLIFHVGDLGEAIYFICTGTVALYSMRGVEIYHFEDGDFFGSLALITPGKRRVTTLVAIEISHVYRLSYDNLSELDKLNPELYERIKKLTRDRFMTLLEVDELTLLEGSPSENISDPSSSK